MKRYNEDYQRCEMEESEDGDWVRFEDVEDMLHKLGYEAGKKHVAEINKCNCEDAVKESKPCLDDEGWPIGFTPNIRWICPAHGYKRL